MPDFDPVHGFSLWVILTESEARRIVQIGAYPDRIREDVRTMLADYDAHLCSAKQQLAKRKAGC